MKMDDYQCNAMPHVKNTYLITHISARVHYNGISMHNYQTRLFSCQSMIDKSDVDYQDNCLQVWWPGIHPLQGCWVFFLFHATQNSYGVHRVSYLMGIKDVFLKVKKAEAWSWLLLLPMSTTFGDLPPLKYNFIIARVAHLLSLLKYTTPCSY